MLHQRAILFMDRVDRCKRIAAAAETLSQTETEELFRILHKHRFDYTRNNHGVFINLSWVPDTVLKQMEEYIDFCHQSKHELMKYESLCDALNTKLVANEEGGTSKGKRDAKVFLARPTERDDSAASVGDASSEKKVSASMRFYLLKKKYSKVSAGQGNMESDLSHDEYKINS